jgi:hypothetical protein
MTREKPFRKYFLKRSGSFCSLERAEKAISPIAGFRLFIDKKQLLCSAVNVDRVSAPSSAVHNLLDIITNVGHVTVYAVWTDSSKSRVGSPESVVA